MFASYLLPVLTALQLVAAAPHGNVLSTNHHHRRNGTTRALEGRASSGPFTGRTTFYRTTDSDPMTACGELYKSDSEVIVALSMSQFSMDLCHQYITVQYNGKTVSAEILDGCETCSFGQIDLSPGAMSQLADNYVELGQFTSTWWIGGGGGSDDSNDQQSSSSSSSSTPQWTPTSTSTTPEWTPTPSSTSTSSTSDVPTTSSTSTSAISTTSLLPTSTNITSTLPLNATTFTSAANATQTAAFATIVLNATQTMAAADVAVTQTVSADDDGGLARINQLVLSLGRLVWAGASLSS